SGSRRQPLMGCCTEALEKDCVAARWAPRRRCPPCAALLAAQNQHGTVTVWRESSFDEGCCLVAEARWSIPGFNALSWVVPADWECDSEDVDWWEDKVPLRPTQHGVAANTALSASLVVLGVDGLTLFSLESANAALPLQCRRRQIAGCPSVAMPSLCSSQTFSVGGLLFVKEGDSATPSWDAWLCSQSGDLLRMRLDSDSSRVVAAAGGAVPPAAEEVLDMAVSRFWGLVALLLGNSHSLGSSLWLFEMPWLRAELGHGHYQVPEGEPLHQDPLGTLQC
ncbi:unnamed protein product, partial [Durusdinium trenchii]